MPLDLKHQDHKSQSVVIRHFLYNVAALGDVLFGTIGPLCHKRGSTTLHHAVPQNTKDTRLIGGGGMLDPPSENWFFCEKVFTTCEHCYLRSNLVAVVPPRLWAFFERIGGHHSQCFVSFDVFPIAWS